MKHKIPNTNLELSDSEINAVVEFAYNNRNGGSDTKAEEFEISEKYKDMIHIGESGIKRLKEKFGGEIPYPKYYTPTNNKVI